MHPTNHPDAPFAYRHDGAYIAAAYDLRRTRQAHFEAPNDVVAYDAYEVALARVRLEEDRIIAASRVVPASAVPVRFAPRGVQ